MKARPLPRVLLVEDDVSLQRFVRVSSVVYPELGAFYRERLRWWVANRFAGSKGRMQYAEPLDGALEAWWRRGR